MAEFIRVAAVDEIPVGKMKPVEVNNQRVVICRLEDGFYALNDECTHDFAPISTGRIRGEQIVCPRHGAKFDVRTGAVMAPPAIVGLDTYQIKIDNGDIYVLFD